MKTLLRLIIVAVLACIVAAPAGVAVAETAEEKACKEKGGVSVSQIFNREEGPSARFGNECFGNENQNPIFSMLGYFINLFGVVFGLILVLILIIAGIQYITSAGSPDGVKAAKERIKAAATGLVLYVLMFGILQILLPPDVRLFTN